jgi:hypothetical protein
LQESGKDTSAIGARLEESKRIIRELTESAKNWSQNYSRSGLTRPAILQHDHFGAG